MYFFLRSLHLVCYLPQIWSGCSKSFWHISQDWSMLVKRTQESSKYSAWMPLRITCGPGCHGGLNPADGARLPSHKRRDSLVLQPLLITIHFKGWKAVFREKSLLAQSLCICERPNYISSSFMLAVNLWILQVNFVS